MSSKWLIITEILIIAGSLYLVCKIEQKNQNAIKNSDTGLVGLNLHGRYELEPYKPNIAVRASEEEM